MSVKKEAKNEKMDAAAEQAVCAAIASYYKTDVVTTRQINEYVKATGCVYPHFLFKNKSYAVKFGHYRVADSNAIESEVVNTSVAEIHPERSVRVKAAENLTDDLIPVKDKTYVPFGFYNELKKIVSSNIFYTVYITGLSGNGKTFMVEQVCANAKREMIRVNITKETDETDLIGSYELIDGNTVRREGPVVTAMRKGAVLLLDEVDYGSERLLCLQPILEGKPYFDKKTGELIYPKEGFNIIATANTKGKGSEDGRFIGANTLNEAFLERFAITVEQEYPDTSVEKQIVERNFASLNITEPQFVENLVTWAEIVRTSYFEGNVDEIISTRRLVHICKAYSIFKNRLKSVELCLNRFDTETKRSFLDLYTKVDAEAEPVVVVENEDENTVTAFIPDPAALAAIPQPLTQPNKKNNTVPAATPQTAVQAGTRSPIGNKMPAWGTAMVLFNISAKYNEKVVIRFDAVIDGYHVHSHGKSTFVKSSAVQGLTEKKEGEILDLMVSTNQQKQAGQLVDNYQPIT